MDASTAIQRTFALARYLRGGRWEPVAKGMEEVLGTAVPANKLSAYFTGTRWPEADKMLAVVAVALGYKSFEELLGYLELLGYERADPALLRKLDNRIRRQSQKRPARPADVEVSEAKKQVAAARRNRGNK